jgi:ATP-binding cassette subfamily B multidrug efflux pump
LQRSSSFKVLAGRKMAYKYNRQYQKELLVAKQLDAALLRRLFGYFVPYKKWLMLALLFMVIGKVLEAYVPIYIGYMMQKILSSFNDSAESKDILFHHVGVGTAWMIALLLISYGCDMANILLKSWLGQKAILKLRTSVYRHILHLPLSYYNQNAVGRLMTRTIHDIEQIDLMFTDSLVPLVGNVILFICIAVGMVVVDWRAALIMVFVLPLIIGVLYVFRKAQRRCYELIRAIVSTMNSFLQEHLTGLSTIHNFGLEKKEKKRFEEINEDLCNSNLESVQHFGFLIAGIDFLSNFTLILIFAGLVAFSPIGSPFEAGTYFTFSLYVTMFFRPLIDLAERYNVLQSAFAASERVFDVLDQATESQKEEGPDLKEIESIVFEDVWLAYENENWVIRGLNLTVRKGESLAIVGATGAGKTSIMGLLLRLYEFQRGTITINGIDIRQYSLKTLRKQFSMVYQDPILFSGTLRDNIGLYDPNLTLEQIEKAVDFIEMRSIVDRYPDKLEHHLLEQGKSLSMGEKQLVSMARAVVHNTSVLLLDEATSNIDTGTEKIIQDALNRILKNKTAIVIAHRLSTVKNVDRIVVMHSGQVVESGSHAALLELKGVYEKLYRLQYLAG